MEYLNCQTGGTATPSSDGHEMTLQAIKSALSGWAKIFYKYPIVDRVGDRFSESPDFVVLDDNLGLIVVICKGYTADDIETIQGPDWVLAKSSTRERPLNVAEQVAIQIENFFKRRERLRDQGLQSKIPTRRFVGLPNITRKEWENLDLDTDSKFLLFADDLSHSAARIESQLKEQGELADLSDIELETAYGVLTHGDIISGGQLNEAFEPQSKGELLDLVENGIKTLDSKQQRIGYQIPQGPQQIRGIAGSGKTVISAMKAAKIHYENPDWKIAITFRNQSLYQTLEKLIGHFYAKFTGGDEPDWKNKLHVRHGWGGKRKPGMYYDITTSAGHQPRDKNSARYEFGYLEPSELLRRCCQEILNTDDIEQEYDAIIIDEAQDFKSSFYKMCYEALKDTTLGKRRLIWAYDEAQNLASLSAPKATEIFGRNEQGEPIVDVGTKYEGGVNATHVLRRSYRTPRRVLMTAHGLGMGLKRDKGIIQTLTSQKEWEDIGYNVLDGDFSTDSIGERVTITRPRKHSPHPLLGNDKATPFINFESFESREKELEDVAECISENIEEGIPPDEILVICLWPYGDRKKSRQKLSEFIDNKVGSLHRENDSFCHFAGEGNRDEFWSDGKITLSGAIRARGNEASMVYILGLEQLDKSNWAQYMAENDTWHDDYVRVRNEAFVALTRTKAWCRMSGSEQDPPIFDEIREILDETDGLDPQLTFKTPNPESLDNQMEFKKVAQADVREYLYD